MKKLFVDARPWDKELVVTALESGADGVFVESAEPVSDLGKILTIAPDGDLIPGTDIHEITISSTEEQEIAMELAKRGAIIVHTPDWTIIPLENLVAVGREVIASVTTREEAVTALTILEHGVSGVLVKTSDPDVIRDIASLIQQETCRIPLVPLTVRSVQPAGMGDRVCVDTCTMMQDGDGMLVGNTSSGLVLVHAETLDNPYVASRPFRVNAGAVHSYLQVPDGKTAYLADIRTGNKTLIIHADGSCRISTVGRVKIERRPLLLVEAEYQGRQVSAILQNAETIRVAQPGGGALPVTKLSPGDTILGLVMEGGRHFGMAVRETILEK